MCSLLPSGGGTNGVALAPGSMMHPQKAVIAADARLAKRELSATLACAGMCAASRVLLPACTPASRAAPHAHRRSAAPTPRVRLCRDESGTFALRRSSPPLCVTAAMAAASSPPPLVVVGSVNADLVVESRLPQPGETVAATGGGVTLPGGKGANQAAAAALCGYPTCFVGQTGRDAPAGVLRSALSQCGVDLTHCTSVDSPTGQAIIVLQPDGENSIIIVGGANTAWSAPGEEALRQVAASGMLLLQREVPESVSLVAARAARAAGVPVILDAGGNEDPICEELLGLVTVLSPNETELSRLTGLPTDTEAHILAAASALQQRGVDTVLVKLGSQGSLLVPPHGGAPVRQPAFKADKVRAHGGLLWVLCCPCMSHSLTSIPCSRPFLQVVDTTGAGDCFTASFAVALLQGRSHGEAMRFASAAACLCVQRMGAMPSLPRRQEVDEFLAQQPAK